MNEFGLYHYSAYWRTWNRVLLNGFDGQYVDLTLTHINGDWGSVKAENIRVHSTHRASNDRLQSTLPHSVRNDMIVNLGHELTRRLLTFDYLPNIDWTIYKRIVNGGAPFHKVRTSLSLQDF